jgi:CRISPR-associated endonuclease Cas1
MRLQPTPKAIAVSRSGVCVTSGISQIRVDRGHLVVTGGVGRDRYEGRFARPGSSLRRLVVISRTGYFSLASLAWLADVGISLVCLDPTDGRLLAASAGFGLDDPRLRRAQALAWGTPTGMAIARHLLELKLAGQAQVAARLPSGAEAIEVIQRAQARLASCTSPAELMVVEAAAASAYWSAWSSVVVPWVRKDLSRIPSHWLTVGPRSSPITGSPRLAVTPIHSLLNLLFSVAEAESRLACLACGLDSGVPVLHSLARARDSLALDALEVVRPLVESWVLDLLESSVFSAGDFHEDRRGSVRVLAPLSHRLAETGPLWAARLGPVVEGITAALADAADMRIGRLPTRLTQANRSAGRDELRRQPRRAEGNRLPRLARTICRGCGAELRAGHSWCDACRPDVKLQAGLDGLAAGRALRAELRLRSRDPAASDTAKAKLHDSLRRRRAEESAWDRDNPQVSDPTVFRRDVLPLIRGVPVRQLAAMTGLSVGYCALVRRGLRTPHARWWETLRIVGAGTPDHASIALIQ